MSDHTLKFKINWSIKQSDYKLKLKSKLLKYSVIWGGKMKYLDQVGFIKLRKRTTMKSSKKNRWK